MRLTNRTILITGGTNGIGLALATLLLERGNSVIISGRDESRLANAQRALPSVHVVQSDVSDPKAIQSLHASLLARFPSLDVLVNNAGVMRNLKLAQSRDLRDVTREIDINLSGPLRMVQQFLPHLLTRPEAGIINVSSGLAFIPFTPAPVYSAAKAGMHAYTQVLRSQLAGTRIAVIELAPPGPETPLFRGEFAEETRGQKAMDVTTVAKRAVAGIEAGTLEIRPGLPKVLRIVSRVAPGFMFRQITRMSTPRPH
ncbi:MAG: SDR family NAD(P)-dependent oxidoreductase [Gemmatimonadota bacterium]|nr:SDR family NAD(P)-dependent oxidoreductase [Gemmatimonadota bacterium]